jgi:hypothetical protein
MSGCHRDVATESPGGCDQDSGRRVGVAPLTRRRRASAWMHERPSQTENSGDYAGGGGWKSTRMPLQYAEKINAAMSGMARAAEKTGRDDR